MTLRQCASKSGLRILSSGKESSPGSCTTAWAPRGGAGPFLLGGAFAPSICMQEQTDYTLCQLWLPVKLQGTGPARRYSSTHSLCP